MVGHLESLTLRSGARALAGGDGDSWPLNSRQKKEQEGARAPGWGAAGQFMVGGEPQAEEPVKSISIKTHKKKH